MFPEIVEQQQQCHFPSTFLKSWQASSLFLSIQKKLWQSVLGPWNESRTGVAPIDWPSITLGDIYRHPCTFIVTIRLSAGFWGMETLFVEQGTNA